MLVDCGPRSGHGGPGRGGGEGARRALRKGGKKQQQQEQQPREGVALQEPASSVRQAGRTFSSRGFLAGSRCADDFVTTRLEPWRVDAGGARFADVLHCL